jgi:ATP-dependent Lhr-like helicase
MHPRSTVVSESPELPFREPTRRWFTEAFGEATPVQARGWPRIARGDHTLLLAPTGSGKTLAAFLWCLDRLAMLPDDASPGVRVVYVSPLKALVYDIERNLRTPLAGIERTAKRLGQQVQVPRTAIRTGDTPSKERQRQLKHPAEVLVTTPESLYLLLGSQARETLRSVETVIVDEVHALASTKRGAHLALSLERLAALAPADPQRIGLSATARPTSRVAEYLGGDRPVSVEDATRPPELNLRIVVPVHDMTRPPAPSADEAAANASEPGTGNQETGEGDARPEPAGGSVLAEQARPPNPGMWPVLHPRLVELIRARRSTIVFVNSRGLCERLCQRLNETAGEDEPLVRAHHGSVSHEQRREVEEALKEGRIRGIVATSSLELGIDMGAVDLVVMVESPGSVARGLQRVGRAGHAVGETSEGRVFPKHRGDLLEAAVVARGMLDARIEQLALPRNPLDVLAQHVVAMTALEPCAVDRIGQLARRCASFRTLPGDALTGVLDMLSGHYPSSEFADLRPRIHWDRDADVVQGRRGSKQLALVNGGTIPDRGLYGVHLGAEGPRVGELDEEMVHETTAGQTITLGASTWRVEQITHDRVVVQPAPGEPGKLPFWHGEGPGRPLELGRALGAFLRELGSMGREQAEQWLTREYPVDALAARNLVAYVSEQQEATGTLPTDRAITVERFRDELGDWRICILTPFGGRVHAPWAMALRARLSARAGFDVPALWSDDGIVVTLADDDELPELDVLLPDPDELEDRVLEQLGESALFASQFRENAARSLLLPRRRPGARTPLWAQRLRAQKLLAVARQYPSFPVIMETYRSCLQDHFDLPALLDVLRAVRSRQVRVDTVTTSSASPFSQSLVFAYVAAHMYEGDSPLAERRAQALSLDRNLLRELLGQEELRELLDASVIAQVETELQWMDPDHQARHPDALHDMLRQIGELGEDELRARCGTDPAPWLEQLQSERRIIPMRIGGRACWIAVEDAALYRDAFGASPPPGVPAAFLESPDRPLESIVGRYARTHGPFEASALVDRYPVSAPQAESVLRTLEQDERVLEGAFHPEGGRREWCNPDVLRRIKRRTLARLRGEVAPVDGATVARFLPGWHGIEEPSSLPEDAITQLEGLPLSYAELERVLLPARIERFDPSMLDQLGAMGWLVWVGHGALGPDDGRVALYRRDRVARLLEPRGIPDDFGPVHHRIADHLGDRGASFFMELQRAAHPATRSEVRSALWDLVWAGLVTNDTFHPLRSLKRVHGRRRGSRHVDEDRTIGGRWSLVRDLLADAPSPTERTYARAMMLLQRHGIVGRAVAGLEELPGGYGPVHKVLRAMEDAGKVRRGYFVETLDGPQYALPGAVDRLRSARRTGDAPTVRVLSAVDPANPYGWMTPWPSPTHGHGRTPRRVAGAFVVLVDGHVVLYVERGGRKLRTFAGTDRDQLGRATRALGEVADTLRPRALRVEEIDGESARHSALAPLLREASFWADHRGLVLESR